MSEFKLSDKKIDLSDAYAQVTYYDGKIVKPLSKNYNGLDRLDMKSVSVIKDGKSLYTLPIVGNKLIYRKRNLARGVAGEEISFDDPKRCVILATEGKIAFIWDSGEIKELNTWSRKEPYTCPNLRDDEK